VFKTLIVLKHRHIYRQYSPRGAWTFAVENNCCRIFIDTANFKL